MASLAVLEGEYCSRSTEPFLISLRFFSVTYFWLLDSQNWRA